MTTESRSSWTLVSAVNTLLNHFELKRSRGMGGTAPTDASSRRRRRVENVTNDDVCAGARDDGGSGRLSTSAYVSGSAEESGCATRLCVDGDDATAE